MSINRIIYEDSCCAYNAYVNQRNAYKELKLKWVFGSCAYNGFWEYGGPDYDCYSDFDNGDFHCWLEDKEGRVYDYITARHDFCARFNTGKPLKLRGLVEGRSKEELKSLGITYLPASEKVRLEAFLDKLPMMKKAEAVVISGCIYTAYKDDNQIPSSVYDRISINLAKVLKEKGIMVIPPKNKKSITAKA